MILSGKQLCGVLVRADTGERIPWGTWADIPDDPMAEGEFKALVLDVAGKPAVPRRTYRGRCRLRFIAGQATAIGNTGTPHLPAISSPGLPGERGGVPVLALRNRPCQHYGCNRLATWKTADEQELPALQTASGQYERAAFVRARYWCDWHYQWPTLRHLDGEVESVEVQARPD